jgi:hypothetical protein
MGDTIAISLHVSRIENMIIGYCPNKKYFFIDFLPWKTHITHIFELLKNSQTNQFVIYKE